MAINASMQWWVRQSGNVLNGGGFDSAVASSGTNYADQDSPQLSLTDLATSGANSTTLTSATGGFTTAMIGNVIRIASGTNFTAGYYVVTARTDTNTVTLDRTPSPSGAGSSGVGRLGGAFAGIDSLHNGGGAANPTITTPLAAGHQVNIRGSGSDNPSSADYTYTNYYSFPAGDFTSGYIRLVGYNGRPRIHVSGLTLWQLNYFLVENLYFYCSSFSNFPSLGVIQGYANAHLTNVWCDQAGQDAWGFLDITSARFCYMFNSGSSSQGNASYAAIGFTIQTYGAFSGFNVINGWRNNGIYSGQDMAAIAFNVICNNKRNGVVRVGGDANRNWSMYANSIYGNTNDGIRISDANNIAQCYVRDNIIEANGGYGINLEVGSTALNDRRVWKSMDRNFFYNNTSGNQVNKSAGANDVTLTASAFTNASAGDFSLNSNSGGGALVRQASIVFPNSFATSYIDGGAIQAAASGGGAGFRSVNIRGGADQ